MFFMFGGYAAIFKKDQPKKLILFFDNVKKI